MSYSKNPPTVDLNQEDRFIPFKKAYATIVEQADKNKKTNKIPFPYVPESKLIEALRLTPGLIFPEGIAWDDIYNHMKDWGWIKILEFQGLEERIFIPQAELIKKKRNNSNIYKLSDF